MTKTMIAMTVVLMMLVGCAADERVAQEQQDVTSDVCLCEGDECVQAWIEENLGCGLCATLVCGEETLSACVLCPDAQRSAPEEVVIEAVQR